MKNEIINLITKYEMKLGEINYAYAGGFIILYLKDFSILVSLLLFTYLTIGIFLNVAHFWLCSHYLNKCLEGSPKNHTHLSQKICLGWFALSLPVGLTLIGVYHGS